MLYYRTRIYIGITASLLTLWSTVCVAQLYHLTDLGDLGGGSSTAYAINNHGVIVGQSNAGPLLGNLAFIYSDGQMVQQTFGDGSGCLLKGINDTGDYVGKGMVSSHSHAFLNGIDLDPLGTQSSAEDINNSRQVVGVVNFVVSNVSYTHAFLYENGTMELPFGGTDYGSTARGINNLGHIVGQVWSANGDDFAFLYADSQTTDIGTLGGRTYPLKINDHDEVVGYSEVGAVDGGDDRAFLWKNGTMKNLGTFGIFYSYAFDINNRSQVVGYAYFPALPLPIGHAFVYDSSHGMQDLNGLIPPGSGWVLNVANGINDSGQIVGEGTLNGHRRAFLVSPPKIRVDIFDPNPALLADDGTLVNDVDRASNISIARIGTVADGISKLLLIGHSDDSLKFEIQGRDPVDVTDGALAVLGSTDTSSSAAVVPSYTTSNGSGVAIAVFTPPQSYGNTTNGTRSVYVVVRDLQNGGVDSQIVEIKLERPPVVLVHGLWSKPMVWIDGGWIDTLAVSHGFKVLLADYAGAAAATFDPLANNKPGILSVRNKITEALANFHSRSIACAQVDVVGHSMGGLMTRGLIQQPDYIALANYERGWVHRLITIGTPHLGSPIAKILWDNQNLGVYTSGGEAITVGNVLASAGMPVDQGAIEGFIPVPRSVALSHLQETRVKSHAIVGTWAPGAIASATTLQTILQILTRNRSLDLDSVFGDTDYDLIVGTTSEYGGLSPAAQYTSFFNSTTHAAFPLITANAGEQTETSNPLIMQKVVALLSSSDPNDFADGFPAPGPTSVQFLPPTMTAKRPMNGLQKVLTGGIQITEPSNGTIFEHHDSTNITISVQTTGGASLQKMIFLVEGVGGFVAPASPPYSISFTLPRFAPTGRIRISALGLDSTDVLLGDTTSIVIKPPSTLYELAVQQTELTLTPTNLSEQLLVLGEFYWNATGTSIQLNISQGSQGTTYSTRRGHVSVSTDGFVSGLSDGVDTLDVRNATFAVLVPVMVTVSSTDVKPRRLLPTAYSLLQNYPNPFNPVTTIGYDLPKAAYVTLKVYNVLGEEVAVLVDQMQDAGYKSVKWNAGTFPSGVYFYRLMSRSFVETKKLLLLK